MNGFNFAFEGPNITGWWVNPKTGDKFNAIDTFFEDNNLLIKTSDGRLLNYNKVQDYVQTKNPDSIVSNVQQKQPHTDDLPPEVLNELKNDNGVSDNKEDDLNALLIPEDDIFDHKPTNTIDDPIKNREVKNNNIKDFDIIDRALSGKQTPTPTAQISWNQFPKREIEMLIDIMNISEDEIIQYYINSISNSIVQSMIENGIRDYIHQALHDEPEAPTKGSLKIKEQETTQVVNSFDNGVTKTKTVEKTQQDIKKKTTKKKING